MANREESEEVNNQKRSMFKVALISLAFNML